MNSKKVSEMKILFQLNHPAHYHLFKNSIASLKRNGNDVIIVAKEKDILKELLINEDYILTKVKKGKNIWEKIKLINLSKNELLEIVKSIKPDIVVGTGTFSFITKKLGIPTLFFGEDDANLNVPIFIGALLYYSDFSELLSPKVCNNSIWNSRTIKYDGYHELAYLHPNNFTPDKKIVNKYFDVDKNYFILRFAKLNAYHDIGIKGINTEIAQNIINLLKPHGDIYITSERELEPQFEQYRIKINPLDMHHVLAYASLYIGDSQTMAAESGVLGTPFIRYNDFVGRIGYLNEIENVYKLGYGIKTKDTDQLYKKIIDLLNMENRIDVFQNRKKKMLNDKIDCNAFFTWFIEHYPLSAKIMKENPDYQYRFK
jgi:predicted glycosyltransferase